MLAINNVSFYFGSRALYENISLHIKPKDRIGLIGANGTGKSTLLRLISGEYTPDAGNVSKSNDCSIGFLNQDLLSYQSKESILKVTMEVFKEQNQLQSEIDKILHQLEHDYSEDLVHKLAELQERFEALDGYTIQAKSEEILEGLGFKTEDLQRPLKEFSGGWRMRVMLARLLLQKPALLMLDEPTNHLDLPSIQWIEKYLIDYEGAIIVVSHDRQFLDNVASSIVEISTQELHFYSGNYSYFVEEKALRKEIQQSAYENQQQKIRQTERFIERFKAKSTKARQVQSRVKSLERMDKVEEVVDENAKVNFKFNFKQASGKVVMNLENIGKSFGNLTILKNTGVVVERGDKIALIGANGRGKSTLLRIVAGTEPVKGQRTLGYNVNFAFYAQHQLEALRIENDVLEELKQEGTAKTETELRNVLGCFLFSNEDVFKKIKVLSGGEKSRVALAKVLISEANFLLLDEPTNHLDMQSVNILNQALKQYQGTFIVVSHDRHFISQIANKIWYIENQEIKEFPGTYREYEFWRLDKEAKNTAEIKQEANIQKKEKDLMPKLKPNHQEDKTFKKELKNLNEQIQNIEKEAEELENQKNNLEKKLAEPEIYNNKGQLSLTQQSYKIALEKLKNVHEAWEKIILQIDTMENKLNSTVE